MKRTLRILMLPWLAHGHLSPFIELAKRLSSRNNFHFTLCSTRVNLLSISRRHHRLPVDLVELQLPQLPDLPPDLHTTKHLPPHLMPALKSAFDLAEPAFGDVLDALHPEILVYDFLQPWAPVAASRRSIPSVLFIPAGAAIMSFFYHLMAKEKRDIPHPLPALTLDDREIERSMRLVQSEAGGMSDGERLMRCLERSSGFVLFKSFREVEEPYIDYINRNTLVRKEHIPVGPLVQDYPLEENEDSSKLMQWLDKKERFSVLFASFGSEYFMEEEELREIGKGLQQCGLDFIWVVRFPMGEEKERSTFTDDLQVGFSERHVILQGWAPQGEILAHRSTGGFLTHCGWSSLMEAMRYGVPMAAMPCHLDQPVNARVMVDVGVALEIKREVDGMYRGEDVARVVKEVVVGDEGKLLRKRATEMQKKIEENGDRELDYVSEKLVQLASALE